MRSVVPMRIAKVGYVLISAVSCILGIIMFLRPEAAAPWAGKALGIGMVVFGVIKLVGYFSKDLFRLAFQYDLAFGVLLITLGISTLTHPYGTMSFLCVMFGIPVLADGLFKIQIALDSRRFGIRKWWLMLVLASAACALGAVLAFCPAVSTQALTILIGGGLFMDGVLNLSVALCAVKIIRHQQPDVINAEYYEIGEDE